VLQHSVEGVGEINLRRDSSAMTTVGTDLGEVRTERSCGAEEIPKAEN
jgi:hypothetical protein